MKALRSSTGRTISLYVSGGIFTLLIVLALCAGHWPRPWWGALGFGLALLVFGIGPVIWITQEIFYRRGRERRGLCRRCGYDLQSSKHVCPECGFDHIWQKSQPVVTTEWWLDALRRAAIVSLLVLVGPAIGTGWLYLEYSAERQAMAKLTAWGYTFRTAPVRSSWLPEPVERLIRPLLERVVFVAVPSEVTDADLKHVQGLAHLQELDLSSSQVTNAGLLKLQGLARLKDLAVDHTTISHDGIVSLKRRMPWLDIRLVRYQHPADPWTRSLAETSKQSLAVKTGQRNPVTASNRWRRSSAAALSVGPSGHASGSLRPPGIQMGNWEPGNAADLGHQRALPAIPSQFGPPAPGHQLTLAVVHDSSAAAVKLNPPAGPLSSSGRKMLPPVFSIRSHPDPTLGPQRAVAPQQDAKLAGAFRQTAETLGPSGLDSTQAFRYPASIQLTPRLETSGHVYEATIIMDQWPAAQAPMGRGGSAFDYSPARLKRRGHTDYLRPTPRAERGIVVNRAPTALDTRISGQRMGGRLAH